MVGYNPDGTLYVGIAHRFPSGGDECGWDGHDAPNIQCSRCGGDSFCHTRWWTLECHIACGPEGGALAAAGEIETALERGDVEALAAALRGERDGVAIEYLSEGGRIDLILPCDPGRTYWAIPVLPEMRHRLDAELAVAAASGPPQAAGSS